MNRSEILTEAIDLTANRRDAEYGTPHANGKMISSMWSAYFGTEVSPHDVWNCMAMVKICRTKKSPQKLDNYTDGAAYMAMAGEVAGAQQKDNLTKILDGVGRLSHDDKQRVKQVLGE